MTILRKHGLSGLLVWALVAAALLTLASPSPAHAEDNGTFAVDPAVPEGAGARQYFQLGLTAGSTVQDAVAITNRSDEPLDLTLFAVDGKPSTDGTFAIKTPEEEQTDVGAWVSLPVDQLTVPPNTTATVPFSIVVPADAAPGDHTGVIIASNNVVAPSELDGGAGINQQFAVGARVYARVDGDIVEEVSIEDLRVTQRNGGWSSYVGGPVDVTVEYTIRNTGNVRTIPKISAVLNPLFGDGRPLESPELAELLPGSSISVSEDVDDIQAFGRLTAEVTVQAGAFSAKDSTSLLVVPWLLVAIVAAFIAGIIWWRHRRRAATTRAPSEDGPDPRHLADANAP